MNRTYRRALAVAVIGCTAAVGLVACGDDDSGSGTSGSDLKAVLVTFGGVLDENVKQGVTDPLAEETGLQVAYDGPTDYGKIETEVDSGNVTSTVIQADPFWAIEECGTLLEKIPSDVDLSDIDPTYLTEGDCSVPGDIFAWTLIYDDAKYPDAKPTTWADFFDTEKFPGKRAMWGSYAVNGALEAALLADGVAPEDLYPLDLDRAYAKLDTIKDDIVFFDSIAQSEQQLTDGEVAMSLTVNSTGYAAAKENPDVTPAFEAGVIAGWDAYAIPKGANLEAASLILNKIATPESQETVSNSLALGQTVKDPKVTGDELQLEWNPSSPENAEYVIPQDQAYLAENSKEVFDSWTEWTVG